MPVVTCPKCPTQLRVPESATGNVRCPKCQHIFPVGAKTPSAPAFEVVDEAPAKPAAKPAQAARPAPTPAARPTPSPPPPPPPAAKKSKPDDDVDVEIEEDDAPRKKKRRDDDYDDDDDDRDRPRGRRRRDDDDDDDRDRDRPRRKRRRRDDDYDDDDDDDRRPAKGNPFATATTGMLLLSIGLWLYLGTFGLMALFMLIGMATNIPEGLFAIPGFLGAANTVLTLVAMGFLIAGPARSRGMAIATVSVAAAHLVFVIICYSKLTGGPRGMGAGMFGGVDWMLLGTTLPILNLILPILIYIKGMGPSGEGIWFVLAAVCELTRCILVCLTIKSVAVASKDNYAAERGTVAMIFTCIAAGVAAVVALLAVVIVFEGKLVKSAEYVAGLTSTLIFAGYAVMTLLTAGAAVEAKTGAARMARRRR